MAQRKRRPPEDTRTAPEVKAPASETGAGEGGPAGEIAAPKTSKRAGTKARKPGDAAAPKGQGTKARKPRRSPAVREDEVSAGGTAVRTESATRTVADATASALAPVTEATGAVVLDVGADALQMVSFMLAGEEYGFPIMRVQEVLRTRYVHITPIPNAPSFIEGVMNLRGRVIPVVGLRRRFGMPEQPVERGARVIVVEVSGRTIGVTVDSVVEVVTVDGAAIEPLPELVATPHSEFIIGVSRTGERIVIVLDMDRVFSNEERAAIAEMASASREEASCA